MNLKEHTINERKSNIELLKILAIFLIIIFHFNQTLTTVLEEGVPYLIEIQDFALTNPVSAYMLGVIRGFGSTGNYIFLICSIWFLLDSDKLYGRKISKLVTDVWFVSVIILTIVLISGTSDISRPDIIKCLFPTTFSNNWYITKYILFLLVLPYLNMAVKALSQKKHLAAVLFFVAVKLVINPFARVWNGLKLDTFIFGEWIVFFLIVSYMKKYLPKFMANIKINVVLLIAAAAFLYLIPAAIDVFGIECPSVIKILNIYWADDDFKSELIAIALFNIFNNIELKSSIINNISKLSLLIYIIHENILLRLYYRPLLFEWIYENVGYDYIVGLVIVLAFMTFVCSAILAFIYKKTLGLISKKAGNYIYKCIEMVGTQIADKLLKIK